MSAEVEKTALTPIFLYEGEFNSGWLRLWTGYGTLVHSGNDWAGAGELLKTVGVVETTEVRATNVSITLTGQPSALISMVLGQFSHNKSARVWLGMLTGSGTVITDPYLAFSGKMDAPEINDAGETCEITIPCESRLVDLQRPRIRYYSPVDQQLTYPGDRGFDFVASLQDKVLVWGQQGAAQPAYAQPAAATSDIYSDWQSNVNGWSGVW
jgi:hypothetical protein